MIQRLFALRRLIFLALAAATLFAGMYVGALWRLHRNHGEASGAVASEHTAVKVSSRRDGDTTQFIVENRERSEVTMTFDFKIVNMTGDVEFPHTATFEPGRSVAFSLRPDASGRPWEYSYTNYYKLGSAVAVPDDFLYELPYAQGSAHKVTQGFNGKFSHKGSNQYAIDWRMPEGTPIHAARGGLVVKVKDDSDKGGNSIKYDTYNNFVLIRHSDGTLAHYCHLQKGGVAVRPGETVHTGQLIALSGNTGFSSGPHLHFCVFKTRSGRERESIPIRFRGPEGRGVILVEGRTYRAPGIRTALAESEDGTESGAAIQ